MGLLMIEHFNSDKELLKGYKKSMVKPSKGKKVSVFHKNKDFDWRRE